MLSWKKTKCGKFFARSLYASLAKREREPFSTNIVWNPWIPMKVGFFAWEVA